MKEVKDFIKAGSEKLLINISLGNYLSEVIENKYKMKCNNKDIVD